MSVATEAVQPRQMADVLRELAEVLESNQIELDYVSIFRGVVDLFEGDFIKLFKGETLTGTRDDNYVVVRTEKFGFKWKANIYRPMEANGQTVTITL